MAKGNRGAPRQPITFEGACDALERALRGPLRHELVAEISKERTFAAALGRLRTAMVSHSFPEAGTGLPLKDVVADFDGRARREGFVLMKEWHQAANRFSEHDIPVLMLDYFASTSAPAQQDARALAVLLDFYFLYVLSLLVMRVWDEGNPNRNLDRVSGLISDLQGPDGSGQRFVEDAATLLFVGTSNYQPDDHAYHRLLERVWSLDEAHRLALALIGGPVLGTHLRWALTAIYERDLVRMRDDNAIDYPWLFFSVATLMREYAHALEGADQRLVGSARARIADALLNALSADPWAFVAEPPASLAKFAGVHAEFRELFGRHRDALLEELEGRAPAPERYAPISLQFNFPHNALVAIVVLALLAAVPLPNLPFNALLTEPSGRWSDQEAELLARAVTGYAAANPERRGDRRVLTVAYNPPLGLRSFTRTIGALRRTAQGGPAAAGTDQSAAMPSA
jgi:hypothetical protein